MASGIDRITSPAMRPTWPTRQVARSPARPWRYVAKHAASHGDNPCANKPAIIPVRTSPVPAVANPGLPVELMAMRPSGAATIVPAPLRTT